MHKRRRPADVRKLLLQATAALLSEKAYDAVSTKEIAERAGVSESALFRHFATKSKLAAEAVVEPFADFVTGLTAAWESQPPEVYDDETFMRWFIEELYDHLCDRRELLLTMLAVSRTADGKTLNGEVAAQLDALFDRLRLIGEQRARERRGSARPGIELSVRVVVGMVTAAAILDTWLMPDGPGPAAVIDELVATALHGQHR